MSESVWIVSAGQVDNDEILAVVATEAEADAFIADNASHPEARDWVTERYEIGWKQDLGRS